MAKRKKKKKGGQNAFRIDLTDDRLPKLLGILLWFFAFYLLIAFTSYLFTWREDQDSVLRFSWELLLRSDMEMENWLGRLGAIVSNLFFYWGFGLASFAVIYILVVLGAGLIRKRSVLQYFGKIRVAIILMCCLAVFLEFFFANIDFPIGGAFGEGVYLWLHNFVGTAGMIILFLFIVLAFGIWSFNPNFEDLNSQETFDEAKAYYGALLRGRRPPRPAKPNAPATKKEKTPEKLPETQDWSIVTDKADGSGVEKPKPQLSIPLDTETSTPPAKESSLSAKDGREVVSTPGPSLRQQNPLVPATQEPVKEPFDPTLELSTYEHPVMALLEEYADQKVEIDRAELEQNKDQIIETLLNYKIEIVKIRATIGPTVTLYEIVPAPGVRISRIKNLEDDIALSLSALGIRIIAPIPGKGTIGIEVPNKKKQIVAMREVLLSEKFKRAKMDLPIALGKTISNEVFIADLAKMPHLLIAGATGQGKSVGINAVLMSLLYRKHPAEVKFVLVDPKKVELFPYSRLKQHFLSYLPDQDEPITTETNRVINTLNALCIEMDNRYNLLKKASARNIREYNVKFIQRKLNPENGHHYMPFIVLVVDEFADLIMTAGKEVELPIARLAQLARAVGIHLIIATQRPSVNIITGVIKANFPARIAYKVMSKVDSRTILDAGGADQLIGRGDMLLSVGGEMVRLQGAFVDTPEVERVIDFIAGQQGYPEPYLLPEYHGDDQEIQGAAGLKYSELDEMFEDAARIIVQNQHGSTSMIQRRLKLGYNRAGRIMDQLEALGVVGPSEGSKAREVLIYDELELERYLEDLRNRS